MWPRPGASPLTASLGTTGNSQALEGTFSPYMPSALGTFPDFVMLGPLLLITGEKGSVREE